MKTINGNSILGTGNVSISGATLADGDYGDITVSGSGTVMTIDNLAVTNAKINDVDWSKVTGEPTTLSGYGISDTKANFDTACSDGDFLYVGDIIGVTDGWTTIVKSANQDVTNNGTLQDDTDLQFSVVANGHYMVEMNICYSANDTTGDYRGSLALSTGLMRGTGFTTGMGTTSAYQAALLTANNSINVGNITLGAIISNIDHLQAFTVVFNFYVDSNATFKYQFCNQSAAAGRTSRTWKGSILKYKRID